MTAPPLLAMQGIAKAYGGVPALQEVSFTLHAGEIRALVGENGAGKSTLVKILAGAVGRDRGTIRLDGEPVELRSPAAALARGIGMIYQDPQLVPALSVAENVHLGAEPVRGRSGLVDRPAMERATRELLAELGETIDPEAPVGSLTAARRQVVAIARALSRRVRILVLDEPTAALTEHEAGTLFRIVRRLRDTGVGVVYITHRLDEVFALADRVTVLRDGREALTAPAIELDRPALIRAMVGRDLVREFPAQSRARGEELLRVEGLASGFVGPVGFALHRGEILGLAGLVGSGRSELAAALFGAAPRTAGRIVLEGRAIDPRTPGQAIALGLGLLTEDRDRLGLVGSMDVRENVTLAHLDDVASGPFLRRGREAAAARAQVDGLRIRPADIAMPVPHLSGGNRQKVVLARWLHTRSRVLLFDEPTAGVDVGARFEIYTLIHRLAASGTGILVISSDLPELLGLCDRILVLCEGRLAGELRAAEATQEAILQLASGGAAGPGREGAARAPRGER